MDIVFIRTKLQALIALELINKGIISNDFIFVKNYWKDINEDSVLVNHYYSLIESKARKTLFFIERSGLGSNSLLILYLSFVAVVTRGKFFFAGINIYSFAIAKFFNPFLKLHTFDDGFANINKESIYFQEKKLPQKIGIRRFIINFLFPKGSAHFLRERISRHFTIYPGKENIVEDKMLSSIQLQWKELLTESDIEKLKQLKFTNEFNILIGTTFFEHSENFIPFLKDKFENKFDLIIPHPRDFSEVSSWDNAFEFESVAESIIDHFLSAYPDLKINAYHFRSSTVNAFNDLSNLEFFDLWQAAEADDTLGEQSYTQEKILIYVDTIPHLRISNYIIKQFPKDQYFYITTSELVAKKISGMNYYYASSRIDILKFILSISKQYSFNVLMAARVDDLSFQLLFKFMKISALYTFDEGLFTIQGSSIYNSQQKIPRSAGWKQFISSRLFNYPIPAAEFYLKTKKHFTVFPKASFVNSIIDTSKLHQLDIEKEPKAINKIFIGQPWQYMYFKTHELQKLSSFINKSEIDLYLIHPREDNLMVDLLNQKISIISASTSSEELINRIVGQNIINVYTVASTLATGLSNNSQITIITMNDMDPRLKASQDNLALALKSLGIRFEQLDIS